ncbi:hypothetical protein [Synechococcus sp. PCC 6312]|uniref:hypothetical protein n=1 Tax=Synechococcus sp. (strain ATCC 27167 / PCC 6312) TaxID=195253 RepID=UPI00029F1E8B|nr:hypothetical protein [Synechococcus sp. PCC 6312]AFY60469.1 hypothetical protein Syn6312_1288 [Synechococcus sp. PCC 6312]
MEHDQAAVRKVSEVKKLLHQSQRNQAELLTLTANLVQAREQELTQDLQTLSHLPSIPQSAWTISLMRRQFKNFPTARRHFRQLYDIRANNWQTLIERVNVIETALVHLRLTIR